MARRGQVEESKNRGFRWWNVGGYGLASVFAMGFLDGRNGLRKEEDHDIDSRLDMDSRRFFSADQGEFLYDS